MKRLLAFLLILTGHAVSAAPISANESSMRGAELRVCDALGERCLALRSQKTTGSQFKALHTLKQPTVEIFSRDGKLLEKIEGTAGQLDFDNHQIVIYQRRQDQLTEIFFDLNTLAKQEMRIR